jgi:hypothetical protein
MENKTDNFRVKLRLADTNFKPFVIPNFYHVPRKGDLINVKDLIIETNYSAEELEKICSLSWVVWFVSWGKDDTGYYAKIVCDAE